MSTDNYSGKFRLFRKEDWPKLPAMRWQIKDLVPLHGVTLLFGQPKVGKKSFVGISQACAVAAGQDWCGHKTQKGNVLYVVGEGFYGILRRQAAWEKLHGCSADNLRYLRVPVNFSSADGVKAALKALKAQDFNPSFIVIDTLARSMSGAKENVAEDMSRVFELLEAFRTTLSDASILIIHHTTKDGLNYRGSSVIPAAVDGLIESKAKNGLDITITSAGFKDVPEFDAFDVRCEPVSVETEDGWQNVLAVTERVGNSISAAAAETERHARELVQIMAQHFPHGATNAQLRKQSGMKDSTFDRAFAYAHKTKAWFAGGGGRGKQYNLSPEPSASVSPSPSPSPPLSYRELGVIGGDQAAPMGVSWGRVGGDGDTVDCKITDTTSPNKKPNKINRGENLASTVPLAPESGVDLGELDAFGEAMEQIASRPSRRPGAR